MHLRPSVLGFSVCFSFVSPVFFFFTYTVEKKKEIMVFSRRWMGLVISIKIIPDLGLER